MMTWFDAILVTLLALVTALGARRGLAGAVWGVGAVALCWLCNLLSGLPALVAALLLSMGLALGTQRLAVPHQDFPWWHGLAGALGGLAFGLSLIFAFTLGFPLQIKGTTQLYPAPASVTGSFYSALKNSYIQNSLQKVWVQNDIVQTLLVPDQTKHAADLP